MNPFDFANPVTDRAIFAGRARELNEVNYYLDLAKSQKAIGLAIVGERTSGKTSILNMASAAAIERGFLSVRLDLTEADVTSETAFLVSLYESLFLAAKKKCFWGTDTENVYEAFRDVMDGENVTRLKAYCDLSFPKMYARTLSRTPDTLNFPPALLIDDLNGLISSCDIEGLPGIALLIDEADHLSRLRPALEKLRHAMTVAKGLIVIVSGTENMLGTMDAVFSPIVRQFKRIRLKPFISPSETRECLLLRLRRVGKEGVLDHSTYHELHKLADGHPYEAQLIAHHIYRRFSERPEAGFSLTVSVLNDVLADVERFRVDEHRHFASKLRSYTKQEFLQLAAIVELPRVSLYEKAKLDTALREPGRVKEKISVRRDELRKWAGKYVKDKIIVYNKTTKGYEIAGGQFDRLYAKLLANSHRIPWTLDDRSLVELTEELVVRAMLEGNEARGYPPFVIERNVSVARTVRTDGDEQLAFAETRFGEVVRQLARFVGSVDFRRAVREVMVEVRRGKEPHVWMPTFLADAGAVASIWRRGEFVPTAAVELTNEEDGVRMSVWLQPREFTVPKEKWSQRIEEYLESYRWGMEALGWRGRLEGVEAEEPEDITEVMTACKRMDLPAVIEHITEEAMRLSTVSRYLNGRASDAEEIVCMALEHTTGIQRAAHLNNFAYLKMSQGELTEAREVLESICASWAPAVDCPRYNLALCKAKMGHLDEALRDLRELQKLMIAERFRDYGAAVLMVVEGKDGDGVSTGERVDIKIEDATRESIEAIERVMSHPALKVDGDLV